MHPDVNSPYKQNAELIQWALFFNHCSEGETTHLEDCTVIKLLQGKTRPVNLLYWKTINIFRGQHISQLVILENHKYLAERDRTSHLFILENHQFLAGTDRTSELVKLENYKYFSKREQTSHLVLLENYQYFSGRDRPDFSTCYIGKSSVLTQEDIGPLI